jgi:hypothetical protein
VGDDLLLPGAETAAHGSACEITLLHR